MVTDVSRGDTDPVEWAPAPSSILALCPDVSQDAVVVIPGIMGSALVDTVSGDLLWGLSRLGWYRDAWTSGRSLRKLADLGAGKVEARGLLRFPAWAPLGVIEPYTKLVREIRGVVAHPDAILEFGYDWRLPVEHNARLLAMAARRHLDAWRTHGAQLRARELQPDGRAARLVLVAHSMGGLVARAVGLVEGTGDTPVVTPDIRATITLGTPFEGAAKAAVILSTGHGAPLPLPSGRLRRLAAVLPGLHDLLPTYRCVDTGDDVRRLTPADVEALTGSGELARQSFDFHRRLANVPVISHRPLVGVEQRTAHSLRLHDGVADGLHHTFRVHTDGELVRDGYGRLVRFSGSGDGTVPLNSATPPGLTPQFEAQQHGSLGHVDEVSTFVCSVITGQKQGGRLGRGQLGIDLPTVVEIGAEWSVLVSGVDGPNDATCELVDAETGLLVDLPALQRRDGIWQFAVAVDRAHLHRVSVSGGGGSPVTQLVLATDGGADDD